MGRESGRRWTREEKGRGLARTGDGEKGGGQGEEGTIVMKILKRKKT